MVIKLNENHKDIIMDFVSKEPNINLFIIGDIEQYGFDKDYQEIWGKFDNNNKLEGVLLRYEINFITYIDNLDTDVSEFKEIIKSYEGEKIISGKDDIVKKYEDVLDKFDERNMYFCELTNNKDLVLGNYDIRVATEDDAHKVLDIMKSIDEFTIKQPVEKIKDQIKDNSKKIYYIENDNNQIISISQTTAENSKSAMVVGVATRNGYREKGYMGKCLSKICDDTLKRGKTLCLFYDNKKAGSVYHKLGFKEIGIWTMLVSK